MEKTSHSPKEVNNEIPSSMTTSSLATHSATLSATLALSAPGITSVVHQLATASRNLFTGRNVYHWRRFIECTLRPRKLEGNLTNPQPKEEAHYLKWIDEEDILFTWQLDSMKHEISDHFIDHESVKDVQDEVIRLYSKLEDESRMADLNKKAMELLQEQ